MLYFYISSIKTNQMWQKVHFLQISDNLKSSTKFSAILEFFLGPTLPCSRTFLCPVLKLCITLLGLYPQADAARISFE